MSQNYVMCQYSSEMTCEETVIGPKNTFRSYCSNVFAFKRLEGNIEKAELDGGGQSGGAVFHFIPFSQKKAFEKYRKKTQAISTSEFAAVSDE